MEIFLRCDIPDAPGRLATLAGAIGRAGGDIQAVEVVEAAGDRAVDDLWVRTDDLAAVVAQVRDLPDTAVVHVGPSRGVPGDATTRLATGVEAILSGATPPEDGIATTVGGLLRASSAAIEAVPQRTPRPDRTVLRLPLADRLLVLHREYRFLESEAQRARQILVMCERAARVAEVAATTRAS